MVDSEYSKDIYEPIKISIEAVIRNAEILKFVPCHFKTRKTCIDAFKKLPFLVRHVASQYKTQQISDAAFLENGRILKSVPDSYKNQQLCEKSVEKYPHSLEFAPECCKTQKCMVKMLMLILLQCKVFLNAIKLIARVIKEFVDVYLYLFLFLINMKLKSYVT